MVTRYALVQYPHDEYMHEACMEESPSGAYVHHDDYAALLAENERLKAQRVDLGQLRKAVAGAMSFIAHHSWVWNGTGQHPNTIYTDLQSLLALIDAHKGE